MFSQSPPLQYTDFLDLIACKLGKWNVQFQFLTNQYICVFLTSQIEIVIPASD